MALKDLIQRTYLGTSNFHYFKNDKTQETVIVESTEEDYVKMHGVAGTEFNPVLEGHTWMYSVGGTPKVDSPDGVLGKDEYCVVDQKAYVRFEGDEKIETVEVKPIDIVDGKIDDTKLEPVKGAPIDTPK